MNRSSLSNANISEEGPAPLVASVEESKGRRGCRISPGYGLAAILVLYTVLGLLYDVTVPLFEKPDELKHFAVIQHIQHRGQLPIVRAGIYETWDQEGTQPLLYHLLAAGLVSWLDLEDFEEPPRNPHYVDERSFVWRERGNNNLYLHEPGESWSTDPVILAARLARLLSLLAGIGTLGLTYQLARIIFVDEAPTRPNPQATDPPHLWAYSLPLLAVGLIAFIPQFLHVSSAITNDSLAITLAAAALVGLALIVRHGGSTRYALYLGLVLGLGAITKLSLLYLLPLTGLVLLYDLTRHRSPGRLVVDGVIIGGLIGLLAGWWYWRNWQVYGDVTALDAHLLYRGGPLDPRPTLTEIWQTEIVGLELSFWAAFGAGQILLERWIYTGLRWVKYVVLVGMGLGVWRSVRGQVSGVGYQVSSVKCQVSLAVLALWCLLIFIALLRWMQITPASWGRLLYPTLPALGILAAWSLSQLTISNYQLTIGKHGVPVLGLGLMVALLSLSVIAPFRYINPAYAKTPLVSEAGVSPEELERLDFVYDGAMRLIGYRVEQAAVRPGEWLPVMLYWQAVQPIEKNYTAFVHLLNPAGESLGQANTYPDGGKWPTSMLKPGAVLEDTYYVPVSAEAEAPQAARLALGIFEFEDPDRAAKTAVNVSGEVVEPIVGRVPVVPDEWPKLTPGRPLEIDFGGQIRLVGFDWPVEQPVKAGAVVPLTLYWETLRPPGRDLNLFIQLIDPDTQTQVAGFDGPPRFPTGFWQTGQTLIDQRPLTLPPDLPPGEYHLYIGWYNLEDFARLRLTGANGEGDALLLETVSVE